MFETFGLRPELVQAVIELGYEEPTPIQIEAIPALLNGSDVVGQAQTGTGKTAAFALPMLHTLDLSAKGVQVLVLTPTRELALQVSEAIVGFAKNLRVRVLPVYGGAPYGRQINALDRGVHIVVGTPGRLLDLINKRALDLSDVRYLVLDEADEMLKMGFIEDVESILSETPTERQTALFSATMPDPIRRLSMKYMNSPINVTIARQVLATPQTEQRYYLVRDEQKLAALTRLLEVEEMTSALVFSRTRAGSDELAETLMTRGFMAEAIHGDLSQDARETVLRRFRSGQMNILVATDVVARGIDIQDVSHVVNFDMPHDREDYVHRIGRTGRAGRSGIAITLVTPRERHRLKFFEQFTKQPILRGTLPTKGEVMAKRDERFMNRLEAAMTEDDLKDERTLVAQLAALGVDLAEVAAAAIHMARSSESMRPIEEVKEVKEFDDRPQRYDRNSRDDRSYDRGPRRDNRQEEGMVRLLLNVGRSSGIRPADIVGAIASEAGIPGKAIGKVDIQQHETYVDVKEAHAERVLKQMSRGTLRGRDVRLSRVENGTAVRPQNRRY